MEVYAGKFLIRRIMYGPRKYPLGGVCSPFPFVLLLDLKETGDILPHVNTKPKGRSRNRIGPKSSYHFETFLHPLC